MSRAASNVTGRELAETGLLVAITQQPGSVVITYKKIADKELP